MPEERKSSSGDPGASCLRLGRAHQRSHQRSRSAHSHDGPQAERKISAFNSEIAKPLQAQFQVRIGGGLFNNCNNDGAQNYSRHGDRRGAGTQLTLSQSDKWLRQVSGKVRLCQGLR